MRDPNEYPGFDVAWCRWVTSFVPAPEILVKKIHTSLRAGGRAVFHEYQNYATWQVIPRSAHLERFVAEVMASWRATGGEPDIVATLLPLLTGIGFRLIEVRPLIFAVRAAEFGWQWPASFVNGNSQRLVDLGRVTEEWANALRGEFAALASNPDAVMVTPLVMEIIADKT